MTIDATDSAGGGAGGNNPGSFMPSGTTEEIAGCWGVFKRTEPGAQFDDYFERQDLRQIIYFGIDSIDPEVKFQIEALRVNGKIIHLYQYLRHFFEFRLTYYRVGGFHTKMGNELKFCPQKPVQIIIYPKANLSKFCPGETLSDQT